MLSVLASVVLALACGDRSHLFEGRFYVESRDCVGTTSSIDVVEGDSPARCNPTCLVQPPRSERPSIYVSTMCAPYPFGFESNGFDPRCPSAVAAFERNDTCLADGGSTNPLPSDAATSD